MGKWPSIIQFNFKKTNLLQVLKAAVGAALAIVIALAIGLMNAPSAGIVTLLTVQNTRRETLRLVAKRLLGFVLATAIAILSFTVVGFHAIGFGVFVLLFVGLATVLGLEDAISMNAVLATHYLIWKDINFPLILNEAGLLFVGMSIGILINLAMPRTLPYIKREQEKIDSKISEILSRLANELTRSGGLTEVDALDQCFMDIKEQVEDTQDMAVEAVDNTWQVYTQYLNAYLQMRRRQIQVLDRIYSRLPYQDEVLPQSMDLATFIKEISKDFHEHNDASELLLQWKSLREDYRSQPLPKSRQEFEQRAGLVQILEDLRYFLELKEQFYLEWTELYQDAK